jgi:hypothetical protein
MALMQAAPVKKHTMIGISRITEASCGHAEYPPACCASTAMQAHAIQNLANLHRASAPPNWPGRYAMLLMMSPQLLDFNAKGGNR